MLDLLTYFVGFLWSYTVQLSKMVPFSFVAGLLGEETEIGLEIGHYTSSLTVRLSFVFSLIFTQICLITMFSSSKVDSTY